VPFLRTTVGRKYHKFNTCGLSTDWEYESMEIILDQQLECISLVINPVRPTVPKDRQVFRPDEVSLDTHPESNEAIVSR
jgi:hypothetical protein